MVEGASAGELEFKVASRVREDYFSSAMRRNPLEDGKGTLWLLIGPSGAGKTTIQDKLERMVSYLTVIEPDTDRQLRLHEVQAILASIGRDAGDAAAKRVLESPRELTELLDDPRVVSSTRFRTPQRLDSLISEAKKSSITWPADAAYAYNWIPLAHYGKDAIGRHFVNRAAIDSSLERGDVLIPTTNPTGIRKLRRKYAGNVHVIYLEAESVRKRMNSQGRSSQEVNARLSLNAARMDSYMGYAKKYGIVVKNPGVRDEELPERLSFVASEVAYAMAWVRKHRGFTAHGMHERFAKEVQAAFSAISGRGQLTAGDVMTVPSDIVDLYNNTRLLVWGESEGLEKPADLPSSVKLRVSEVNNLTKQTWRGQYSKGVQSITLQPEADLKYQGPELKIVCGGLINFWLAKSYGILTTNPILGPSDLTVLQYALTARKPKGAAIYATIARVTDP